MAKVAGMGRVELSCFGWKPEIMQANNSNTALQILSFSVLQ
jgi:hypothetical protein